MMEDPLRTRFRDKFWSVPLPFERDRPVVTLPPGSEIMLVAGADQLADHLVATIRAKGHAVRRCYWDSPIDQNTANIGGLILLAPLQTTVETLHAGFHWLRRCAAWLRKS